MKTRSLALLLAVCMILTLFAGCGKAKRDDKPSNQKENTQNGDTWVDDEAASAAGGRVHKKAESIPASFSLIGTEFLPPIGNQGSIGSCSSSSIAYCQFTNAVARYLHSLNPKSEFTPADGDASHLISSKYAMNFAGAGTAWVYDVLKDHGALVRADSDFWRNASGGASGGVKDKPYLESSSWDVEAGEMAKALNMRLLNYEQVWMNGYNFQLTTTDKGRDLIEKIKDAVVTGNVVVTGGFSSYWRYNKIDDDGLGELGKKGDDALVCSLESGTPGGHQVSIVGYDDNITVTMAGQKIKGAFLVANSWGDWKNDGYVWLMYDAVNKESEYEILNAPETLTSHRRLSIGKEKAWFGTNMYLKEINTDLEMIKQGTAQIEGKNYPTYYIKSSNGYLTYTQNSKICVEKNATDESALWAVIPTSDLPRLPGYNETTASREDISGASVLYAVNSKGAKILYCGPAYYSSAEEADLYNLEQMSYSYYNVCLKLDGYNAAKDRQTVCIYGSNGVGDPLVRTYSLDQFCFVYWDCDIACDQPGYTVTVEVDAVDREKFYFELIRTDATGKTLNYVPAMFRYGENFSNVHPDNEYCSAENYLNFKGEVNGGACTGYVTLSYGAIMGVDTSYDNYIWGIQVTTTDKDVKIKKITLKDETGKVLSEIVPQDFANADGRYLFDLGAKPKADGKSGIYKLQNTNGQFLATENKVQLVPGEEKNAAVFDFLSIIGTNRYHLQMFEKTYILDIFGKEVANGIGVRVLNPFGNRTTQEWRIIRNEDGTVNIRLATDTKFAVGIKDDKVCLVSGGDIKTYGTWKLVPGGSLSNTFTVNDNTVTCQKPEKASGSLTASIVDAAGQAIATEKLTFDKNGMATFQPNLPKGCYVLTLLTNNKPVAEADRLIFTVT